MYTIKEIAKITKIPASTIRYYEKIGLLSISRSDNNYRIFTDDDLNKIKYITVMKFAKFSIEEMRGSLILMNSDKSDNCAETSKNLMNAKENQLVEIIEHYKEILELIILLKPLVVSDKQIEYKDILDDKINNIFNKIKNREEQK